MIFSVFDLDSDLEDDVFEEPQYSSVVTYWRVVLAGIIPELCCFLSQMVKVFISKSYPKIVAVSILIFFIFLLFFRPNQT